MPPIVCSACASTIQVSKNVNLCRLLDIVLVKGFAQIQRHASKRKANLREIFVGRWVIGLLLQLRLQDDDLVSWLDTCSDHPSVNVFDEDLESLLLGNNMSVIVVLINK